MKKCWILVMLVLLLTGCSQAGDTYETVADVIPEEIPVMHELALELPEEAASPVSETDDCTIYQCQDYEICVQTLAAGDLDNSIRMLTGYERDRLTMVRTERDGLSCYQFVWACTGDQVGRGMILDDGNYHYCVTVFGDADQTYTNDWEAIFASAKLS